MPNLAWDKEEEVGLAEYIVTRIHDRATGRSEAECLRNFPRDIYFVGNLRPQMDELPDPTIPGHIRELVNKLSPAAFGAEFLLQHENGRLEVNVTVTWNCYYRVFPTLKQQREHQRAATIPESTIEPQTEEAQLDVTQQNIPLENADLDNPAGLEEEVPNQFIPENGSRSRKRRRAQVPKDSLFIRFRKLNCTANALVTLNEEPDGNWLIEDSHLQFALDAECARARQSAMDDPQHLRGVNDPNQRIHVPDTALIS
jgi:hypothetical protein